MKELTENISPNIYDVVSIISDITAKNIDFIEDHDWDKEYKVLTSHVFGSKTDDTCSFSISFALSKNPQNEKTLNFFIVQNTTTADVCLIISSGERDGLKVLFKSINKYPITCIEKYLPNIIKSTITILKKESLLD